MKTLNSWLGLAVLLTGFSSAEQDSTALLKLQMQVAATMGDGYVTQWFALFQLGEAMSDANRREVCATQQPIVTQKYAEVYAISTQTLKVREADPGLSDADWISIQKAGSGVMNQWSSIQKAMNLICQPPAGYTLKTAAQTARLYIEIASLQSTTVFLLLR